MPMFITQGRFTPDAIKGLMAKPENRAEMVGKLFEQLGGKLVAYYMTFGKFDFMVISEGPFDGVITSSLVVAASGGVTGLNTTMAVDSSDMQGAFAKAAAVASKFRAAGAG